MTLDRHGRSIIVVCLMFLLDSSGVFSNALTVTWDQQQEEDAVAPGGDGLRRGNAWQWNSAPAEGGGWSHDRRRKEEKPSWGAGEHEFSAGARVMRRLGLAGGEDEQFEDLATTRDYLNGLVAESAANTRQQACNVAFAKTHKTASTTLAMILVRYARRHDKKLASFGGKHVSAIPLEEAVQQVKESGERVDVMHYHYTSSGSFEGRWEEATSMYKQIMQEVERISYVTVVRGHREHFLSYYYYFVQPEVQLSVEHFSTSKRVDPGYKRQMLRLRNPLCAEFGIRDEAQLNHFILNELPDFRLVILTEAFDEGLMVLRRLMGWEMIDMTYSRMMETKAGARRWDGKDLKNVPHFDDLPESVRNFIDSNTNLDRKLYEAAVKLYAERKAVAAIEIEAELKEFEELQGVMNGYLQRNTSSEAAQWYSGSVQPYLGGPSFHPF